MGEVCFISSVLHIGAAQMATVVFVVLNRLSSQNLKNSFSNAYVISLIYSIFFIQQEDFTFYN